MPDITLWTSNDFASRVQLAAGDKLGLHPYKCPTEFQLALVIRFKEKDKILDKISEDPLLQEKMALAFANSKDYLAIISYFGKALNDINMMNYSTRADDQETSEEAEELYAARFSEAALKPIVEKAMNQMAQAANEVWVHYCEVKKEYTKYKVKIVAEFALVGAGMATTVAINVALLATSSFHFGAGTALGIVGLARSSIQLTNLAIKCLKGVDKAIEDAYSAILTVINDYKKKHKVGDIKQVTKDIANILIDQVFGVDNFMATIKAAKAKLKLANDKVNGTEVALHKLSRKIPKTIARIDKLQANIKDQEKTPLAERVKKGKLGFDLIKIGQMEQKLASQMARVTKANEMLAVRRGLIDGIQPQLDAIAKNHKNKEGVMKAVSVLVELSASVAKLATTDFTAISDLVGTAADVALIIVDKVVVPAATKLVGELVAREKDQLQILTGQDD